MAVSICTTASFSTPTNSSALVLNLILDHQANATCSEMQVCDKIILINILIMFFVDVHIIQFISFSSIFVARFFVLLKFTISR